MARKISIPQPEKTRTGRVRRAVKPFVKPQRSQIPGDKNIAPSQWGRRVARLVGDQFGVKMSLNMSKNEGIYRGKDIVIKCAKSPMPPVSVLIDMLDRIDDLWAVYLMLDGSAEVWSVPVDKVRANGYFTHGLKTQKRVEIYRRKIVHIGKLMGTIEPDDIESCRIP